MFVFRKAVFEDYYSVLSIADTQLGNGYLKGVLKLSFDHFLWVAEERSTKSIVGFIFIILEEQKAVIKSVAIQENYQRKGIGTTLFNIAFERLKDSVDKFEVIAWERSDSGEIPLEGLLLKFGFKEEVRKPQFWYDDSIRRRYICPACGAPCQCTAVIFSIPSSYSSENIG